MVPAGPPPITATSFVFAYCISGRADRAPLGASYQGVWSSLECITCRCAISLRCSEARSVGALPNLAHASRLVTREIVAFCGSARAGDMERKLQMAIELLRQVLSSSNPRNA